MMCYDRNIELEFYKKQFKGFCSDFLRAVDKRFQDLYDLYSFEFFDIEYLKIHSGSSKILQGFMEYTPDLLKKIKHAELFR